MQLAGAVGRNEPCPCGSGRKYKKCCSDRHAAAVSGLAPSSNGDASTEASAARGLDVASLVDEAVVSGDWAEVDDVLASAMSAFEDDGPLAHVRFRDDWLHDRDHDERDLARLCAGGWVAGAQRAIADVLVRDALIDEDERDGLRLAAYLLRRFGAQSLFVEALLEQQLEELNALQLRIRDTLVANGITTSVDASFATVLETVQQVQPPVPTFAEWFALRSARSPEIIEHRWAMGIAHRIAWRCLSLHESAPEASRRMYLLLAVLAARAKLPEMGSLLALHASLHAPTPTEQQCHDALCARPARGREAVALIDQICVERERSGHYADAALLRESVHDLERAVR